MKRLKGYMAGVNLGGWLSQYRGNLARDPEGHFDRFITEADIQKIASWGMDHVRLPFDYPLIEWDEEKQAYNDFGFRYMDRCVAWCRAAGLNVVLDMHQAPGYAFWDKGSDLFTSPERQARFAHLWRTIAARYAGEGGNVMYELLNEVTERTPEKWNELAGRVLAAIREADPLHDVVIGGIGYNNPQALALMERFDDPHVVYNFHMYLPMMFTHLRAGWVEDTRDCPSDLTWPSDAAPYAAWDAEIMRRRGGQPGSETAYYQAHDRMDARFVETALSVVDRFLAERDVPVYCGEYGVIEHADAASRARWMRDVAEYCLRRGIGRAAWTYRGMSFPLIDGEGRALSDDLIRAAAMR